jgi:hypothetical protein
MPKGSSNSSTSSNSSNSSSSSTYYPASGGNYQFWNPNGTPDTFWDDVRNNLDRLPYPK